MEILSGISAWQYHETPPLLREVELTPELMHSVDPQCKEIPSQRTRSNARLAERLIQGRLLTDLKGLSTPVHVMSDSTCGMHDSPLVRMHRIPKGFPTSRAIHIGNGLHVLSPELAACMSYSPRRIVEAAKLLFEACGIFCLPPATERMRIALRLLADHGALKKTNFDGHGIYGYADADGRRLSHLGADGSEPHWIPCFDRHGELTDLWKRPAHTNSEEIALALEEVAGMRGFAMARRALQFVHDGSASPAEVRAVMLLCSGRGLGGESWGRPCLNRRIDLTPEARLVAGTSYCIADILWPERMGILEVQGKAFHADERGFAIASGRRPALESMGYEAPEITHMQMKDLELFDAMLPALAKRLGFCLEKRTPAFLRRRNRLHDELFGRPYRTW